MGYRIKELLKTIGRGRSVIAGAFVANGAGAIDKTGQAVDGYTVARTGVGTYKITLSQPTSLKSYCVPPVLGDGEPIFVFLADNKLGNDGTITFTASIADGTATDIPADTVVAFQLYVCSAGAR